MQEIKKENVSHHWPMQINESDTHLLFTEEVFDQTAHDLLWRPGCADVRSDQTA